MSITTYKTYDKTIERLSMLSSYINKYAHLWDNSNRLFNWVDEYNNLRSELSWEEWKQYCAKYGYAPSHDGYDCLS
jgi:hypothetical protein